MSLPAISGTALFLLVAGIALLVAVGANAFAGRYKVPDALWLIALGVIAGPVLSVVSSSSVLVVAPVIGTAVLVIILFDAGLDMEGAILRTLLPSAVFFAVVTYVSSVVVVSALAYAFLFHGDLALSLFFGAALGASSGAVAIPIANQLGLLPSLRGFVHLDAGIEDAIAIVFASILLLTVTPSGNLSSVDFALALALPIPVGIVAGILGGIIWLLTLSRWQNRSYAALATLGYVLLLYGVTKLFLGSGILAALVAGIVIANAAGIRRLVRWIRPTAVHPTVRAVQTEVAFLFRALFLFFVGTFVVLVNPGIAAVLVLVTLSVGLLGIRYAVAVALSHAHRLELTWTPTLGGVGGRGLTSAVLLVLPISVIPGAESLFLPGVLLIIGTDVAMTVWVWIASRRAPDRPTVGAPSADSGLAEVRPLLERIAREDEERARGPGILDRREPGSADPGPRD